MHDEFDDQAGPMNWATSPGSPSDRMTGHRFSVARLVSRVYGTASEPLRADILACLLRPLGTLSLVAVASGAFARLLQRDGGAPDKVPMDEVARYSNQQILELARFVHEVSPEALQQLGGLLANNAVGVTALERIRPRLAVRQVASCFGTGVDRLGEPDEPLNRIEPGVARRP